MMNKKELNTLIERYMDGETTLDEERKLESYFMKHDNVDGDMASIRQLVLGLGALHEPLTQKNISSGVRKRTQLHVLMRRAAGIAACALLIAGLALTLYRSQNYCEAVVYGHTVTDQETVMPEVSGTIRQIDAQTPVDNQLRDVLLSTE